MRCILLLIAVILPGPIKRAWYRALFGWKIGRRVRIGLSYLDAREVEIGDDVHIGHFNVMRHVVRFTVGARTYIGNLNSFSAPIITKPGWRRTLDIGARSYIMSHHFFDVSGDIVIGDDATIGGRDTHLWTHTLRPTLGGPWLTPRSLRIGDRCYIGARSTLVFCALPDGCFVGAGAVVTKSFESGPERLLIAGNPAVICKTYPNEAAIEDGVGELPPQHGPAH